jgi:hypothetical protein
MDTVTFENETDLEKKFENRLDLFEQKMVNLFSVFAGKQVTQPTNKGKGRGKGKKKCDETGSNSDSAINRINEFIDQSAGTSQSATSSRTSTRSKNRRDLDIESDLFTEDNGPVFPKATKKTIYIKKVDCQLNSNSIDHVEDKTNVDECMQMFWRMYKYNGQVISTFYMLKT